MPPEKNARKKYRQAPLVPTPESRGYPVVNTVAGKAGMVFGPNDLYIGRRNTSRGHNLPQSKWANPITLAECRGDRELCLKKFTEHLHSSPRLMDSLHELVGKTLWCWCRGPHTRTKEQVCHGDVLALECYNNCIRDRDEDALGALKLEKTLIGSEPDPDEESCL